MKTSLFNYDLPEGLIAARPAQARDESRFFHVVRKSGEFRHKRFCELPDMLRPGDVLVLNNSRVFPARLYGRRLPGGGRVEALLLRLQAPGYWWAMVKPGKKIMEGDVLEFGDGLLKADVIQFGGKGERLLKFNCDPSRLNELIHQVGVPPLPPYILKERKRLADEAGQGPEAAQEDREDADRYQTVYAREWGSVAAPTAGLHFTPELLDTLRQRGHEILDVTLHVGPGTFKPVTTDHVEEHPIHVEQYSVDGPVISAIHRAHRQKRRVVAVGTTTVRVLETLAANGELAMKGGSGETNLMIAPGYKFRVVDAMITNFHLPKSTLLMLVCAFGGHTLMMKAYREAIEKGYRFYSYGDAMFID